MVAVSCRGVSKAFRIYHERNQSLKQVAIRRKRLRFEEFWAIRDVTFEIEEGSSFGIIGSNGAGKSTTLKVLAQILQPDRGEVEVKGRVSALLELGAGFHPELSGRENVFLNGAILGLPKKTLTDRFDQIVDMSGLERFIDNPVKTYSSGMYARLGFSVAVNVDPEVLLIDEVLAVGDESFQRKCGEKIASMRSEGRTIVLVSHGLSQVQMLCDKALWIDAGGVREIGSAPDVVNSYLRSVASVTEPDEQDRVHTGTGEARVTAVRFLDDFGREIKHPSCGSPLVIEVIVEANQRIVSPVIGIWIVRTDGVLVSGTRTQHVFDIAEIPRGTSVFQYRVENFGLVPAGYFLSVAVSDDSVQHLYDVCERMCTFDVLPSGSHQVQIGVSSIVGSWSAKQSTLQPGSPDLGAGPIDTVGLR